MKKPFEPQERERERETTNEFGKATNSLEAQSDFDPKIVSFFSLHNEAVLRQGFHEVIGSCEHIFKDSSSPKFKATALDK